MKPLLLLTLFAIATVHTAGAQTAPYGLSSQRQPVTVTTSAVYQRYAEGGDAIQEFSAPLSVVAPVGRRLSLSLAVAPATASGAFAGRDVARLSTYGDAAVGLAYAQPVGSGSLVFSLNASLPSGKRELTEDEFATAFLLSQHYYDFRVPSVGQGANVSPGVTLAVPAGDVVAAGLGLAYQVKGAFKPLAGLETDYDPGDELLLTGGLDVRLGRRAALSGDVSYALYQTDRLGGRAIYGAGDKLTVTVQMRRYAGFDELRLVARYRSRARSEVLAGGTLATEAERTIPNQAEVLASYRVRLSRAVSATFLAGARRYEPTPAYPERRLVDAGLAPEVRLSRALRLQGRLRYVYNFDGFTGYEAGTGLAWRL